MKLFRAIAAVAFVAAITGATFGQPKPNPPAPTTPAQTANLPDAKIALIDSSVFSDEKQGILRFVAAIKKVDAEFQPRRTELESLKTQIDKATADLNKAAPVQDPKVTAQQNDKIEQMKRDLTRKGEDAQSAVDKRLQEVLGPIYEDIGKALDTYAKAHGITLILDVTKVQGIVSASESLDITKSFVAEFNSKNPVTASLTSPK